MSFEKPYYFVAMVFSPLWEGPKWLEVALDANFASVRLDADQSKRFELGQMQLTIAHDEQKTWYLAWRDDQGKWAIGIHDTALQKQLYRAPPPALATQLAALKGSLSSSMDEGKKGGLSALKIALPSFPSVPFGKIIFVVFIVAVILLAFREKIIKAMTQSFVSVDMVQEIKLGEDIYRALYPSLKVLPNKYLQSVLDTAGARLAKGATYSYAWVIIRDENAFDIDVLPSGIMLVPTGLLRRVDSIEALYGVMLNRIQMVEQRLAFQELVATAGWSAFWSLYRQDYDGVVKKLVPNIRGLNYSQKSYYAADRPVFIRLWSINVDPKIWLGYIEKQANWQKRDGKTARTVYPITKERIAYIKDIDARKPADTAYFPVATVDWSMVQRQLPSLVSEAYSQQKRERQVVIDPAAKLTVPSLSGKN